MSWKNFIAVFVSSFLISFPQNIIGCGPGADPYDYYTSFFHQEITGTTGYRPFYYTSYSFLYDEREPAEVSDLLAAEWATYCGGPVTATEAKKFVMEFSRKEVNDLYLNIEKNMSRPIRDSIMQNSMTAYFLKQKDLEALGYILYAKQVEPHVTVGSDEWEMVKRDTAVMGKLVKNGLQLYAVAKQDVFKLKYAYQVVRLALYSGRNEEAIRLYDMYVRPDTIKSILKPLSLALKAGALFRTNRSQEAALLFSKAFNAMEVKRISNYLGFKWSVKPGADRNEYLRLCKTNAEKAGMLALFALGSTDDELTTIKQIYELDPAAEVLEILVTREINKLEENYFTPALKKEKGGKPFYYYWEENSPVIPAAGSKAVEALSDFLHMAGSNTSLKSAGLFQTAAAYTSYLMKDYVNAKKYLALAEKMKLTPKVKDQWALTGILVTINEQTTINPAFEQQLLPSLQWLNERAIKEKPAGAGYFGISQWKKVYRDLLSQVLAKRYHQQGDLYKEALCIGAADEGEPTGEYDDRYARGVEFMRDNLAIKDVEQLYSLVTSKQQSRFEQFLIKNNSISEAAVVDFAGTAYLREYDYTRAAKWFRQTKDKKALMIFTDPFIDLLYDREEPLASEAAFKTDKLAFAETMIQLEKLAASNPANAAKHYYKMANGLYNMTYYGHAWQLVEYSRSGSDGYLIPKNAGAFQREYYGCFSAMKYFEKAMNASGDQNFRARCLFMMAKCSQKQVQRPHYSDYNHNWDQLGIAEKAYWTKFKDNQHFPQLVKEYGTTRFYKEVYNSCSFLRDFVERN